MLAITPHAAIVGVELLTLQNMSNEVRLVLKTAAKLVAVCPEGNEPLCGMETSGCDSAARGRCSPTATFSASASPSAARSASATATSTDQRRHVTASRSAMTSQMRPQFPMRVSQTKTSFSGCHRWWTTQCSQWRSSEVRRERSALSVRSDVADRTACRRMPARRSMPLWPAPLRRACR